MLAFNEWLQERDPELYAEVDWRGLAKKAALGGAIGLGAFGAMSSNGPIDRALVQKAFPNIQIQQLDKSLLKDLTTAARGMKHADSSVVDMQDVDRVLTQADKLLYQGKHGQNPEGGFRSDVPDTHYQNPKFWKQNSLGRGGGIEGATKGFMRNNM